MNGERRLFRREKKRARGIERRGGKRRGSSLPPPPFPCVPSFLARSQERRRRRRRLPRLPREKTLAGEQRGGANARRRKYWVYFEILFRCVGRATLLHAVHRVTHTLLSTSTQLHALLSPLPPSPSPFFPIRIRWTMLLKDEFSHECTSISRFPPARCTPFRNGRDCIEKCRGAWCNWERKKLRYLLKFRVRPGRVYHE